MSVLATIAQIAAIAAVVGAAFSFAVLRPLNASIKDLQKAIDEMRAEMKESGKQRQELEVHLAEVDQSVREMQNTIASGLIGYLGRTAIAHGGGDAHG